MQTNREKAQQLLGYFKKGRELAHDIPNEFDDDLETNTLDALANLAHFLDAAGITPHRLFASALQQYEQDKQRLHPASLEGVDCDIYADDARGKHAMQMYG